MPSSDVEAIDEIKSSSPSSDVEAIEEIKSSLALERCRGQKRRDSLFILKR